MFGQIVSRFGWFSRFAAEQPDQFRFVFQDELLDRTHLIGLCEFLRLSAPENWLDQVAGLIRLRASYPIADEQKAELKALTMRLVPNAAFAARVADQIV